MSDSNTISVSVGNIGVTLPEPPVCATISCGPGICQVGPVAGKRFFDELTKVREALAIAQAVLVARVESGYQATPAEVQLARKLVELEIEPDWNNTLHKLGGY